jgi:hypothetical protein
LVLISKEEILVDLNFDAGGTNKGVPRMMLKLAKY